MKQLSAILPAPTRGHWVGDGFPVRPVFAHLAFTSAISPFLMLDYGGPMAFPRTTEKRGVGPHPHRGFETVTIAFQGEIEHGDSAGNRGVIGAGDVQWMTAASGIVHEEFHARSFGSQGGTLEMVQLWVNLPARFKMAPPRYQPILDADIPRVDLPADSGTVRVIAGDYAGVKGAALTFSPIELWDLRLHAGKRVTLEVPAEQTTMLFVRNGKLNLGAGKLLGPADLALFEKDGTQITLEAMEDTAVLLMGGAPIDEPIAAQGPFVMNTQQELHQAIQDYQSGRMGVMPA